MTSKHAQLWLNQHYTQITHYMWWGLAFIAAIFILVTYTNQERLLGRVEVLSNQNKLLSEQNKVLNVKTGLTGDATQKVVLQNRNYIRCLSQIFANYTQNFVPITITNLDTCSIKSDGTSNSTAVNNKSPVVPVSGPSSNATPPSQPTQPNSLQGNTPPPPRQQPGFLDYLLSGDLLPVGSPLL